jgi:hypothetical protein
MRRAGRRNGHTHFHRNRRGFFIPIIINGYKKQVRSVDQQQHPAQGGQSNEFSQ